MRVVKDDNDTITVYLHSEREKRDVKHFIKMLSLKEFYDISYERKSKGNYGRFVFKLLNYQGCSLSSVN